MKISKIFVFLIITHIIFAIYTLHLPAESLFLGAIQLPKNVRSPLANVYVFYRGDFFDIEVNKEVREISDKVYYEFYDIKSRDVVYMLITESLKLPEKNDFESWQTSAEHPYRFFKLVRYLKPNEEGKLQESWAVQELSHEKPEIDIPVNTFIFSIPPEFVKTLEPLSWPSNTHSIKLPTIILKEDISEEEFDNTCNRLIAGWVDLLGFHEKVKRKRMTLVSHDRTVTLPYSKRFIS